MLWLNNHRNEVVLPSCQVPGQALDTIVTESIRPGVRRRAARRQHADQRRTRLACGGVVFHDASFWIRAEMGETVMLAAEQHNQLRF